MGNIFKAYDIRGKYKRDFDERDAYKIGFFLPELLEVKEILVGRDGRDSSPALFGALCDGITDAGCDVCDMGIVTTPMVYYFTHQYGFEGSVMVTASHNPKEFNGFKISRKDARPVGYDSGLSRLEHYVKEHRIQPAKKKGSVRPFEKREEYISYMKGKCPPLDGLKLVIDCSNGAVCQVAKDIFGLEHTYLNDKLDGNFPGHQPNPLEQKNTLQAQQRVKETGADLGIVFDGDGDRVVFVDENGKYISPDLITAVLAKGCIKNPGDCVIYDIRSSWSVEKYVKKLGGRTFMWKVGHVHAKEKMREVSAVVGGELAGHYYFREFMNCDSGILAAAKVLEQLQKAKAEKRRMSDIINEISRFYYSGEMNFKIERKKEAIDALLLWSDRVDMPFQYYSFDGFRIEYEQWWYNVRVSNTENYLRVVVEAVTKELLDQRVRQIQEILARFQTDNV